MYQLPHLSFAIRGKPYASATAQTNVASSLIDRSRLLIFRVERRSSAKVDDKLVDRVGKIMSEVRMGSGIL